MLLPPSPPFSFFSSSFFLPAFPLSFFFLCFPRLFLFPLCAPCFQPWLPWALAPCCPPAPPSFCFCFLFSTCFFLPAFPLFLVFFCFFPRPCLAGCAMRGWFVCPGLLGVLLCASVVLSLSLLFVRCSLAPLALAGVVWWCLLCLGVCCLDVLCCLLVGPGVVFRWCCRCLAAWLAALWFGVVCLGVLLPCVLFCGAVQLCGGVLSCSAVCLRGCLCLLFVSCRCASAVCVLGCRACVPCLLRQRQAQRARFPAGLQVPRAAAQ